MARSEHGDKPIAYCGEIWTDGRGRAVVFLPVEASGLAMPLRYELETADASVVAAVTAALEDGHFTVETDEPHVKVAWCVTSAAGIREEER